MGDLSASIIRTVVMLVVGGLLTLVAHAGLNLDSAQATEVASVVVTAVYYIVVRFLEAHVNSGFGILLGLPKQPVYVAPAADTFDVDDGSDVAA